MEKKRIQIEEFFPAYMEAAKNGETIQDFAARLGVKPESVSIRVRELRSKGLPVPMLASNVSRAGRKTVVDKVREMLEQYGVDATMASEPPKKKARAKKEKVVRPEVDNDVSEDALKEIFG